MSNIQNFTGQELVDGALARLGGYANAVNPVTMLEYINEGKNELWVYLKGVRQDYFGKYSQSSTVTADDYFGVLSTSTREYELPPDCRELKSIEVLTSAYEGVEFAHRDMSSAEFKSARLSASESGPSSGAVDKFIFDQVGTKLVLAQYPDVAYNLRLWYIAAIPNIELGENAIQFLFPFLEKLKNYGAKRATQGVRDFNGFQAWREEWTKDLQAIVAGAATRDISEPRFVENFMDEDE